MNIVLKHPMKHPRVIYYFPNDDEAIIDESDLTDFADDENAQVIIYKPVEWANIKQVTKVIISDREPLKK